LFKGGQFLSVLLLLLYWPVSEAQNARVEFARPKGFISAEKIRSMNLPKLIELRDRMNADIQALKQVIRRKDNDTVPYDLIYKLRFYQTEEAMEALFAVFRAETARITAGGAGARPEVFMAVIDTIGVIGAAEPHRFLEDYLSVAEKLNALMPDEHPMKVVVGKRMLKAIQVIQSRPETLVDLNKLLFASEQAERTPEKLLTRAQEILEEGLIGQPEVLQALMDMEWRSSLYGTSRTLPDAVYLLGLPGTGKDTAAEVFTDALHGTKSAHRNHMYRLPLMKNKSDLWQLLGSATGYVGSENFPPFLEFLVQHSGGKYKLEEAGKKVFKIVLNPDYKGETLPGYHPPNTGVVFVNEFHNWSKQLKDDFLKQALEKGVFTVNNPNGGLNEIYVPIRFVLASNEGIRLVTSREANGQRHGKPLTYEQMLAKWENTHHNKRALKAEILATNGSPNVGVSGESTPGISEELLNRIPERFVLLMRPLSPEHLKQIAEGYMQDLKSRLTDSPLLGKIHLTWTERVPEVLQSYDYIPEENARPVLGRVMALIEEPLLDALRSNALPKSEGQDLLLDIEVNEDKTRSLVVTLRNSGEPVVIRQTIRATLKDRAKPAISDQRIDELGDLEGYLKANVFGVDNILERLSERVLSIENEAAGGSARPVNVLMLNGLSSTGKTETAKQLAKFVRKADDELVTFDFSAIQTLHDFKVKILGLKDGLGNPVPSEFMKHYDRSNGRLIVAFDELANVRDSDLMKALYDFFREPVVSTFADGKPRPMGGVTVIITGNPGQELFAKVPRHAPMEVQMLAWEEIAKRTSNDPELQRRVLERYYPEPFITRIGRNNIFFLPPHSYKSLRQLAQLKLGQSLAKLASLESRRGWNVVFPSADEYKRFIDMVIDEGFSLRFQGASIESFVRDDVEEKIKYLLLKNKVPSGSTVVVKFRELTTNESEETPGFVFYDVFAEGQNKPLELKIRRPHVEKPLEKNLINDLLTAYHEAGHSIVRNTLFRDAYTSTKISVIPGVSLIGEQWIYYAGIAQAQQNKELFTSRDWAIRQIAILLAGETAERLVSQGGSHSAGKSNDIERATKLARDAITRYGLSEKWGLKAVPTGMSNEDFVAGLSEQEKELLELEVRKLLREGRTLAEQTLEANFNSTFIPLGNLLAEKGVMNEQELSAFYKERQLIDPTEISRIQRALNHARTVVRKWRNTGSGQGAVLLDASLPMPKQFADIQKMALERKRAQYDSVPLPENLPVGTNSAYERTTKGGEIRADDIKAEASCEGALTSRAS